MPLPARLGNLRQLIEESLSQPHRAPLGRELNTALNRARIPKELPPIKQGMPQLPDDPIFDYRNFGDDSMGHLERKDLAMPSSTRGLQNVIGPYRSPNSMEAVIDSARAGARQGGHLWYNTEPLFSFAQDHAPDADIRQFLRIGAPLSAQTSVLKEIPQTAFVNYFRTKHGRMPTVDEMMELGKDILGGGGSPADKLKWAERALQGTLDRTNPQGETEGMAKVVPYMGAREGNRYNAVMDSWILNLLGLDPMLHAKPKAGAEMGMKLLSERAGMMPSNFQAAAWTGMQGDARPYAALLDLAVKKSAEDIEKSPHEHMADVLSGRDYIRSGPQQFVEGGDVPYVSGKVPAKSPPNPQPTKEQPMGVRGAGGGTMKDMLRAAKHHLRPEHLASSLVGHPIKDISTPDAVALGSHLGLKRGLTGTSLLSIADPNDAPQQDDLQAQMNPSDFEEPQNLNVKGYAGGGSLREYIRTLLPNEFKNQTMRRIPGGTGRLTYQVGENAIAKLANMPRGIVENSNEGDYYLRGHNLIPEVLHKSDDDELVLERMYPSNRGMSQSFARPMYNRYLRATAETAPSRWPEIHKDDPQLAQMVAERGLDPFQNYNILGGDFFSPRHWKFDQGNIENPVMIDVGSLVPHLTTSATAKEMSPYFKNMLKNRADFLGMPDYESPEIIDQMLSKPWTMDLKNNISPEYRNLAAQLLGANVKSDPMKSQFDIPFEKPEMAGGGSVVEKILSQARAALDAAKPLPGSKHFVEETNVPHAHFDTMEQGKGWPRYLDRRSLPSVVVLPEGGEMHIRVGDSYVPYSSVKGLAAPELLADPESHALELYRQLGDGKVQLPAEVKPQKFAGGGNVNPEQILQWLDQAEKSYKLPSGILKAIATRESNLNPAAVGKRGEQGLMQFMPATAKETGIDPLDPHQAAFGGGQYFKSLLDRFHDLEPSIAAWNWGPGRVATYGHQRAPKSTKAYIAAILAALKKKEDNAGAAGEQRLPNSGEGGGDDPAALSMLMSLLEPDASDAAQ